MLLKGQLLSAKNLNNAYLSKSSTGEQSISSKLSVGGGEITLKQSVITDNASTGYLRIDPQGSKVIIYDGVNNQRLDIYSSSGTESVFLTAINGTTSYGQLDVNGNLADLRINTSSNKPIYLGTGVVGVGTILPATANGEKLHLFGKQLTSKNNSAIANDSYANSSLELRTTDASHPILGFHRSGYTAVALYHDGSHNQPLRVRTNTGLDSPLWNDHDTRTWGPVMRSQGLMVLPEGKISDNGSGNITIPTTIVMNPLGGSWMRVSGGTYSLGGWGYLYVDMPPTGASRTTVVPQVGAWSDADRVYDGKDRLVLAQRMSSGDIFWNGSTPVNSAGTKSFVLPVGLNAFANA
jgi:hypothetical protein